jgi:kynurenine formamidase
MTDYRASFDAVVRFSNGGDLSVHGFRVDVPSAEVTEDEIGALFVASLGLLMSEPIELSNVSVFAEPHKGTRGGPSDLTQSLPSANGRLVELSHVIRAGVVTYPRFADGDDLSGVPLDKTVDLPAVVARVSGSVSAGIDVGALAALDVRGAAVLLHTGDDARFGTPDYARDRHFLTRAGAGWLVRHGAALVGIDALNLDDTDDTERPARTLLLRVRIPVVERLTGLEQLPPTGARFTAVPLRIEGFGTVPVRAFARLP